MKIVYEGIPKKIEYEEQISVSICQKKRADKYDI
jgi:hypothetical protein